jgi:hypothetical protein
MSNLLSIYLGSLPFFVVILTSYLNLASHHLIKIMTFYYSLAIFNFVCGYHWTLSITVITARARLYALVLSLLGLIPALLFHQGHQHMAILFLGILALAQFLIDLKSDISNSIPFSYKIARLFATSTLLTALLFVNF